MLKINLIGILFLFILSGCAGFRMGPSLAPDRFDFQGPGNGYASYNDLRSYDGEIIQLDILNDSQQNGEILNVDIWPLVGVGIGALGVRAHIAPLGAGFGTLFYYPRSAGYILGHDGYIRLGAD